MSADSRMTPSKSKTTARKSLSLFIFLPDSRQLTAFSPRVLKSAEATIPLWKRRNANGCPVPSPTDEVSEPIAFPSTTKGSGRPDAECTPCGKPRLPDRSNTPWHMTGARWTPCGRRLRMVAEFPHESPVPSAGGHPPPPTLSSRSPDLYDPEAFSMLHRSPHHQP